MHLEWRGPRPPGRSEAASGPSRPCCTTRASRRSWSGRSPCSAPRTPAQPRSVARASPSLPLGPARCRDQSFSRVSGQVSILMKATVLMRQPGRVQEIVGALRRGGGDRLQVPSGRGRTGGSRAAGVSSCPRAFPRCCRHLQALSPQKWPRA